MNIKFPDTNVVGCVFSFRQNNNTVYQGSTWDEYDHRSTKRLKVYNYRVPEYLKNQLKLGDAVLVHCQTGFQLCEVVELNALPGVPEVGLAPVVCKVDLTSYIAEIDRKVLKKKLQVQMEAMQRQIEEEKKYEWFAEKSPEFAALYEQFKALSKEA